MNNFKYLVVGVAFGIIFIKAEIISWFRIQEMFRFHSFHMYGIIGSAILVGTISVQIIKRNNLKSIEGETISIPDKEWGYGKILGGFLFGLGWATTGACPGPLYALIGSGFSVIVVTILFAILGTYLYGILSDILPK